MDEDSLKALTRPQLQKLAKEHGLKANAKSAVIIAQLLQKRSATVPTPNATPQKPVSAKWTTKVASAFASLRSRSASPLAANPAARTADAARLSAAPATQAAPVSPPIQYVGGPGIAHLEITNGATATIPVRRGPPRPEGSSLQDPLGRHLEYYHPKPASPIPEPEQEYLETASVHSSTYTQNAAPSPPPSPTHPEVPFEDPEAAAIKCVNDMAAVHATSTALYERVCDLREVVGDLHKRAQGVKENLAQERGARKRLEKTLLYFLKDIRKNPRRGKGMQKKNGAGKWGHPDTWGGPMYVQEGSWGLPGGEDEKTFSEIDEAMDNHLVENPNFTNPDIDEDVEMEDDSNPLAAQSRSVPVDGQLPPSLSKNPGSRKRPHSEVDDRPVDKDEAPHDADADTHRYAARVRVDSPEPTRKRQHSEVDADPSVVAPEDAAVLHDVDSDTHRYTARPRTDSHVDAAEQHEPSPRLPSPSLSSSSSADKGKRKMSPMEVAIMVENEERLKKLEADEAEAAARNENLESEMLFKAIEMSKRSQSQVSDASAASTSSLPGPSVGTPTTAADNDLVAADAAEEEALAKDGFFFHHLAKELAATRPLVDTTGIPEFEEMYSEYGRLLDVIYASNPSLTPYHESVENIRKGTQLVLSLIAILAALQESDSEDDDADGSSQIQEEQVTESREELEFKELAEQLMERLPPRDRDWGVPGFEERLAAFEDFITNFAAKKAHLSADERVKMARQGKLLVMSLLTTLRAVAGKKRKQNGESLA